MVPSPQGDPGKDSLPAWALPSRTAGTYSPTEKENLHMQAPAVSEVME